MVRVLRVDPTSPEPETIEEARRILAEGGLVAFPTETVYGLGACGMDARAVRRIFEAKGRPAGHPVILHVDGPDMAEGLAASWDVRARALADAYWPGPLTLVVPRRELVPESVSGGLATVGLRMPAHPVALALVRALGAPLAAPSANAHTHVSPTTAEHVVRSLGDAVDLVLDAGSCLHGIESTVVAVGDPPLVLRPGALSLERIRAIAPGARAASEVIETDAPRASPGMAAKHYAPAAHVVLVPRGATMAFADGAAAIVVTEAARAAAAGCRPVQVLPDDPAGYARELYAALHAVDRAGAASVVIEAPPPDDPAWWAVRDRLSRAARR